MLAFDLEVLVELFRRSRLLAELRLWLVAVICLVEILIEALLSLKHRMLVALVRLLHGLVQCRQV